MIGVAGRRGGLASSCAPLANMQKGMYQLSLCSLLQPYTVGCIQLVQI